MADLIERYKITANLPSVLMNYCNRFNSKQIESITEMIYELENSIESAEVQPVNQWISVKERQPDKDDLYLVAVENEICVYIDIADYSNNQWHKHDEVIYWQPLPELPKEG